VDESSYQKAIRLLESDIPKHLVTLKYLALYKKDARVEITGDVKRWAVLSSFPTSILSFDKEAYPRAKVALFVNGTDEALKMHLLQVLPENNYVLRLNEPLDLFALDSFRVSRGYAYNSYTCNALTITPPKVILPDLTELTEQAIKLFGENGHDTTDLKKYFADDARWFGVSINNGIKSLCFTYRDYGNYREIGGVRTLESERRKGYAYIVVYSAIKYLLEKGLLPRYCTEEKNYNSIRLAENLGMKQFLRIEHFLLDPK
jgi:hypothetical protein